MIWFNILGLVLCAAFLALELLEEKTITWFSVLAITGVMINSVAIMLP